MVIGLDVADGVGACSRALCGSAALSMDIRVGILMLPCTIDWDSMWEMAKCGASVRVARVRPGPGGRRT